MFDIFVDNNNPETIQTNQETVNTGIYNCETKNKNGKGITHNAITII